MGLLVDAWKKETEDAAGWNRSNRSTLIGFNTCLGRYMEPEGNSELWMRIKEELENTPGPGWYGNLYTKGIAAAKAAEDPYAEG